MLMGRRMDLRAPRALGNLQGLRQRRVITGDDHLTGAVVIGNLHHPAGERARLGAHRVYRGGIERQNGGHAARRRLIGLAHELAAQTHETQAVTKTEHARDYQRAVFPQTVSGDELGWRRLTERGFDGAPSGDAGYKKRGLRVDGLVERLNRAIEA